MDDDDVSTAPSSSAAPRISDDRSALNERLSLLRKFAALEAYACSRAPHHEECQLCKFDGSLC